MKIELTQDQLDATISALEFAMVRYEQEAAALLDTARHGQDEAFVKLSRKLGQTRLKQADAVTALVDFYLHL